MDIVEILKALADDTRIRIFNLLYKETLCVCDLEEILKLSQSNASRHVTKLKNARLITGEKQAQWIYYRIDEKILNRYPFINALLSQALVDHPQCQKDLVRLKTYRERGGSCERIVRLEDE